ncbi:MAG: hypothetical protein IJM69_04670, partial [Firmicutes bacterium]|nr:hypothetical protein [Bacillota bacterium]
ATAQFRKRLILAILAGGLSPLAALTPGILSQRAFFLPSGDRPIPKTADFRKYVAYWLLPAASRSVAGKRALKSK